MTVQTIATWVTLLGVGLTASCSPLRNAHFGIRPDAPPFAIDDPCQQYEQLVNYSQVLQEAYHSRASQNRFWIYAAGTVALGTLAATGGLGAAGAAGLTIALLSTSGGFASGFFATIDNPTLADVYTISANAVTQGLADSRRQLTFNNGTAEPQSCAVALETLTQRVATASSDLERARTDSAAAALLRAQAQAEALRAILPTPSPSPSATPTTSPNSQS